MKNYKIFLFVLMTSFLLVNCGGSNSSENQSPAIEKHLEKNFIESEKETAKENPLLVEKLHSMMGKYTIVFDADAIDLKIDTEGMSLSDSEMHNVEDTLKKAYKKAFKVSKDKIKEQVLYEIALNDEEIVLNIITKKESKEEGEEPEIDIQTDVLSGFKEGYAIFDANPLAIKKMTELMFSRNPDAILEKISAQLRLDLEDKGEKIPTYDVKIDSKVLARSKKNSAEKVYVQIIIPAQLTAIVE
ncbi:MAG: hypothetical protein A2Z91_01355 [Deltaproteobacteria bacterium GWA2_38_16]|nr:MAG: hypothetical protein A2Z91_01355 [Deltaproteobacteria bacterium GWA2_38_16]OGQ02192.1 MAG: hypothetical protein A3D19_05430 [Deltaproteobacteria bacterium RIFCSPHIGHO2_02_FULL_38_15]OGQ61011.1 MAG: hypothetical protein A3G92_02915 [Deltaproteobacteria bacterium RIFCSPLOWO2_12_FULL_38_8]HBQ21988.1 hypothetical protein [Deltaproteobacteria bacterium]